MQTTRVSAHEVAQRVQEAGGLVPMFARRYRRPGVAFEDLVGAGNVGIIEAAHRFDPNRGVKFCSYAGWWIRKAIIESLQSEMSTVAVPRYAAVRRGRVMAAMKPDPSSEESSRSANDVAAELGLSARQAESAVAYSTHVVSMHSPVAGDTEESWEDRLARPVEESPEAVAMRADRERTLLEALQALPPRQRMVVILRFAGSESDNKLTPFEDVARVMGLSRERVRQIESVALETVRRTLARGTKKRSGRQRSASGGVHPGH